MTQDISSTFCQYCRRA